MRRLISALVGGILLLATLAESYFVTFGFYQDHYVMSMEKYGILTALRWQDEVFLVVCWVVAIGFSYLSFRLLNYSFRRRGARGLSPSTGQR
jgi:hypothetical protein